MTTKRCAIHGAKMGRRPCKQCRIEARDGKKKLVEQYKVKK